MKKVKVAILTMLLTVMCSGVSFAGGIGYIDYERVLESFPYAINARKSLDSKAMAIKQYMFDKEKEYENIQSPVQKQNFQDKVAAELKAKQTDFMREQARVEQETYNKVRGVANSIMVEQKLDAIISDKAVFCGGVDVTKTLIDRLKTVK